MKTEFDFENFIKGFYSNEVLKGFILRVRESNDKDDNDSEEDKSSNIAYYNGIKAFDVINYKNKAELKFPVNVYKCNTTDVRKLKKLGDKEMEAYKNSKISLMNELSKFTNFSFKSISYQLNANSNYKEKYEEKRNEFEKFVKDRCHIQCVLSTKKNKEIKYIIKFAEPITKSQDIIEIQCKYIELLKYDKQQNTITKSDEFNISKTFIENIDFSTFISKIKEGISNYESSDKLEKKYQHYFMLNANESKTLFPREDDEVVTHFEQEYGIINPNPIIGEKNEDGNKTGRIDCIFYKYKPIKEKISNVSDIYLIEIKVNETVILGNNGVMTHLADIKSFLDFKKEENLPKYAKYDVETLKKRIKYRNKVLYNYEETNFNDTKIHFYTVVGFTNEDSRKTVIEQIKGLNEKEYVYKEYKIKENLYTISPDKSKCDVKFFFEKPLFNNESEQISTDFEDVTEKLTPGFISY